MFKDKASAQLCYEAIQYAITELEKRVTERPQEEIFMCLLIEDYLYILGWHCRQINDYNFSSLVAESGCATDGSLGFDLDIPEQREEYLTMHNEYRHLHLGFLAEYIKGEYLE